VDETRKRKEVRAWTNLDLIMMVGIRMMVKAKICVRAGDVIVMRKITDIIPPHQMAARRLLEQF
jgi:hypothetical protein